MRTNGSRSQDASKLGTLQPAVRIGWSLTIV